MDTQRPEWEAARLGALHDLHILDTDAEQEFNDLVELARTLCGAPVALVSLVDAERQWFKAKAGVDLCETERAHSFCAHAIRQEGLFVVPDMLSDPRFVDNPFVAGEPHVRFYAGMPLVTPAGHALGTLCVVDVVPRSLTPAQAGALEALGRQAVSLLELRRNARLARQKSQEHQRAEAVLRVSREKLALALATARMGTCDWDMAHERVDCSAEAGLLLGLRAGTVPTTYGQFLAAVHPEDREGIEQTIQVAAFVESGYGLEFRVFDPNGEERWLEATAQVERDEAGWPAGYRGTLQDITKRKRTEQALRQSEDRLQTVIQRAPVILFMLDRDGTITLSEGKGLEALGLRPGEAVGTNAYDINRDNPALLKSMRRAYAGEAVNFVAEVQGLSFESWYSPVLDADGIVSGIVGVSVDVTERAQAVGQMRAYQEMLQSTMDNIPQRIFWKDSDLVYRGCNVNFARAAGLSASEEVVGKTDYDLPWDAAEAELFRAVDRRVMSADRPEYRIVESQRQADGRETWVETNKVPLHDVEGRVVGVLGTYEDVTDRRAAEVALCASEASLQRKTSLLLAQQEATLDGLLIVDENRRIVTANRRFREMWAIPDDLIRRGDGREAMRHMADRLQDSAGYRRRVEELYTSGEEMSHDELLLTDGRIIERRSARVTGADGGSNGRVWYFRDITERKAMEESLYAQSERLSRSEARMAEAQRMACIGSWEYDVITGRVAWSDEMFRLYGLDPADGPPTAAQVSACYLPDDVPEHDALTGRCLQDGRPYEMDIRIVRPDGAVHWAHTAGQGERDATGRVMRLFGTVADVHESRIQEAALRASEAALQRKNATLLAQQEATVDGLLIVDEDRRVVTANRRFREMWAVPAAMAEGGDDRALLSFVLGQVRDRDEFLARVLHLYEHPAEISEDEFHLVDGRVFDRRSAPVTTRDGRNNGRVWYFRDVTAQKRSERELVLARDAALASTQAKSAFLANMSHEIRTPMNGILGMTRLLLQSPLAPAQRHYAATVQNSAVALLAIINDILDVSKVEAGKMAVEVAEFDLRVAIEEVMDLLTPRAQEKGVQLSYRMPLDFPQRLRGDGARLRQILTNLVGNALKFTPSGEVTVEVALLEQTAARAAFRLAVCDTGIGIPADRQAAIFDSFTQADNGVSRRFGGTGLGLTICRQLVELMGGRIGVRSETGRGSEFWLTLTLDKQVQPHVFLPDTLRGLRVLVVDAEVGARAVLCDQLRSWDCHAVEAGTVDECLERLRGAAAGVPFGLVLLSLPMLDMAGSYFADQLRRCAGWTGALLTLLSPGGPTQVPEDLRGLGYVHSLQKPVRQSALYNAIIETLPGHAPAGESPAGPDHMTGGDDLTGLRVLLAEDNEINQEVAVAILESWGCRVDVVGDGWRALEALERSPYDVVLMDVQMPEMDGLEATARLRARERGTGRRQPIVAMTAHSMAGDREQCLSAGMDGYAAKPIERAALRAELARWRPAPPVSLPPPAPSPPTPEAAPAPEAAGPPVMDFERLSRSCAGKAALERRIMGESLRLMPLGLARLREAVAASQAEAVRFEAHTLKGSSRTIGAEALGAVCADLEQTARAGDLADAPQRLAQAEREWVRLQEALETAQGQERWRAA